MRDLFSSLYETFDKYGQEKEQMVWFAANAYLVFIVAVTGFLLTHTDLWSTRTILR